MSRWCNTGFWRGSGYRSEEWVEERSHACLWRVS